MIVDEVDCVGHILRDAICHGVIDRRESIHGPRDEDGRNLWESEKHSSRIYREMHSFRKCVYTCATLLHCM